LSIDAAYVAFRSSRAADERHLSRGHLSSASEVFLSIQQLHSWQWLPHGYFFMRSQPLQIWRLSSMTTGNANQMRRNALGKPPCAGGGDPDVIHRTDRKRGEFIPHFGNRLKRRAAEKGIGGYAPVSVANDMAGSGGAERGPSAHGVHSDLPPHWTAAALGAKTSAAWLCHGPAGRQHRSAGAESADGPCALQRRRARRWSGNDCCLHPYQARDNSKAIRSGDGCTAPLVCRSEAMARCRITRSCCVSIDATSSDWIRG
jgi:hypothetical protein